MSPGHFPDDLLQRRARELQHRAIAKFRRRSELRNPFLAFVLTFFEALFTLFGLRSLYRGGRKLARRGRPLAPGEVAPHSGD